MTAPDAYLAGPYAAYRLSQNLVLGARAAWGEISDGTTPISEAQIFTTNRLLTEARLSGNWAFGQWQLMPAASISYVGDTTVASISGLSNATAQTTRFTAGPQLRRLIDAGDAGILEPFAFCKTSLDLESVKVMPEHHRRRRRPQSAGGLFHPGDRRLQRDRWRRAARPVDCRSGLGLGAFALKPVKPPRACASGRST